MKKFFEEFKAFISRGNVMDLAVGVIIGGAFQKIVTSLVGDIITPLLGIFGSKDFSDMVWVIREAVDETDPGLVVKYGAFITAIIDFIIMAFIIFLLIKGINRLTSLAKKPEEEIVEEPTTKKCPFCCSEIAIEAKRCPNCTSELTEA